MKEVRKSETWDETDPQKSMISLASLSVWDFIINDMQRGHSWILDIEGQWLDFHFEQVRPARMENGLVGSRMRGQKSIP